MKKTVLLILILFSINISAQTDCSDALIVCGNTGYQDLKASGIGIQELNGTNTCSSAENNSLWFKLLINTGGTLGFTLTPNSSSINEDFDFFIFGPDAMCNNLGKAIRCSTTNPLAASQGKNLTGMNASETDVSEGPGSDGNSFVQWLTVSDGDTYFLVIDRPIGDSNFSLEWTGTATFFEQPTFNNPTPEALNIEQCDTDAILDEQSTFDLTIKSNLTIGLQTDIVATYHTSNNDALLNINPLSNTSNYKNISNPQTIFIRLTNVNTECFDVTTFDLIVKPSINLGTANNLITCDYNEDGFVTFDLSKNDSAINPDLVNNNILYFDNEVDAKNNNIANALTKNYTNKVAFTNEIIWARVSNILEGCYNITSFSIEPAALPTINLIFLLKQCDEDGLADGNTDFNLDEANPFLTMGNNQLKVTYHLTFNDADTNSNTISASPFSNKTQSTVYARIYNINNCHKVAQVDLLVSSTHFSNGYLKIDSTCDNDNLNDGFNTFDLNLNDLDIINALPPGQNLEVSYYTSLIDAQLEINKIDKSMPYTNSVAFNEIIFVRVESNDYGECFGLGPHLNLIVHPRPKFELDKTAIFCVNLPPITISTYNPDGVYKYEWKNEIGKTISNSSDVIISGAGLYTVIATSIKECVSFPQTIKIEPSIIASITENDISIIDDSENNSITISTLNLGIGNYEFALKGINGFISQYQDDPHFKGLKPGIYTIFIRDKNSCGIAKIEISIIGYPKFFTPNNDGQNDKWQVLGVNKDFYASSNIFIFNRFGKLIKKIDPKGEGWDGLINGQYLPSTDYWFSVELKDKNGNSKIRKGHFSLIRR